MLPRSWGPDSLAVWRPGSHLPRDIKPCSPSPWVPPKPSVSNRQWLPRSGYYRALSLEPLCPWRDPMTFNDVEQVSPDPLLWGP